MITQLHPYNAFPEFHNNQTINYLAQTNRWTVSDNNARPIDIVGLMRTGKVFGAKPDLFDTSLMTLSELNHALPDAANATYFADFESDGVLIFDIEKTCPPEIANQILSWPNLYSEVSKSGRGFHVIMPAPSDPTVLQDLENITVAALRGPSGVLEVLLHHWVTLTRNVVTQADLANLARRVDAARGENVTNFDPNSAETIYDTDLADIDFSTLDTALRGLIDYRNATAVQYNTNKLDDTDIATVSNLPFYFEIITELTDIECDLTLADYNDDHSRYEFAMLAWLHNQFFAIANKYQVRSCYDNHAQAVVIYQAITQRIEPRDKHNTRRSDMPYLLYSANRYVSLST